MTGAGGAICGRIVEDLAKKGVRVALVDINTAAMGKRVAAIHASGGEVSAYTCNVTDIKGLKEVYADIIKRWGTPDFLVNGAGGNHPDGTTSEEFLVTDDISNKQSHTFFDMDVSYFKKVVDLNFYGTLFSTQVFSRDMAGKGFGSIVNISSMSGIIPLTKVVAYSAAKAAVINFTRWMAVYLAHSGVRVNTIAPGFISTEQSRYLQFDKETGEINERGKAIIKKTPMARFGFPEDLIGTVIWLLSEASCFVTGIVVPVDGGFSSYSI